MKKPYRSQDYLDYIRQQVCVFCSHGPPSEPHHISWVDGGTMGGKPSDLFTIPVCRVCHDGFHRWAKEFKFDREFVLREMVKLLAKWVAELSA